MFRRCKFTSFCKFNHKINDFGQENTKQIMNENIDTLVKTSKALENNIEDMKNKIEIVEKELIEKEKVIIELGEKIKVLEDRNDTYKLNETITDNKLNTIEEKIDEKIVVIDSLKESMDYCDKMLDKKCGINIYPNMYCENCKIKLRLRDGWDLRKHMESVHRIFKCDIDSKCEYEGESDLARKIHVKEIHRRKK